MYSALSEGGSSPSDWASCAASSASAFDRSSPHDLAHVHSVLGDLAQLREGETWTALHRRQVSRALHLTAALLGHKVQPQPAPGKLCIAKAVHEDTGCTWGAGHVLTGVARSSPADQAGAGEFVGRRLECLNGRRVPDEISLDACWARTRLVFAFAPPDADGDA
eukprot:TRINITY_DN7302_c0_g1_i1.p1 TRINITY_DN7302_c0_g1~~TRINITY_DN7302_c0_g1_i1.p1  ORF type:complete len:164 (+),score=19.30 TRINITY_DN7302_c0_g1_i1:91-582(+)